MLHLSLITVNVSSLFIQIYDIESMGNKHYVCFQIHFEEFILSPDCSCPGSALYCYICRQKKRFPGHT